MFVVVVALVVAVAVVAVVAVVGCCSFCYLLLSGVCWCLLPFLFFQLLFVGLRHGLFFLSMSLIVVSLRGCLCLRVVVCFCLWLCVAVRCVLLFVVVRVVVVSLF